MGCHKNISYDKFPDQGSLLNKEVEVCFWYDTSKLLRAKCVRDDRQEPYRALFMLEDGRIIDATECQYSLGVQ